MVQKNLKIRDHDIAIVEIFDFKSLTSRRRTDTCTDVDLESLNNSCNINVSVKQCNAATSYMNACQLHA